MRGNELTQGDSVQTGRRHREQHVRLISLTSLIIVMGAIFLRTQFELVDDAYLSFRYAYNLAHTGELVFNSGERVEGITNLLWTLILAVETAVLNLPVERFVLILSLCLIAFSCFRLWQLGLLIGGSPAVGALAALLLLLNPEFIGTATNGLEAPLYTLLLVEAVYRFYLGQLNTAFLLSGLLFMTRPEGMLFGLLLAGLTWFEHGSLRRAGVGVSIFAGLTLLITLFRVSYYGMPLPNSVVAKSFDIRLLPQLSGGVISYAAGFAQASPYLIVIAVWGLFRFCQARSLRDRRESTSVLIFCMTGIALSFVVMARNGGDWMANHRLLLQYGSLYSVALICLASRTVATKLIACALIVLPFLQTVYVLAAPGVRPWLNYPVARGFEVETSRRLAPVLDHSDTVSSEALGYISYSLIHNRFHDPIGLMDPYIARYGQPAPTFGKTDSAYTIGVVRPSVMVWHFAGHVQGVPQGLLDQYEAFCAADCESRGGGDVWPGDIVMIRWDRLGDLARAFSDWKRVTITTNSFGVSQ